MAGLFFYFFLALGVSFLCSLLEAVLLSVRRPYVALLVEDERRCGHMWVKLKARVNHPLAAILSLNTIANTLGAAGVGAQVARLSGNDGHMVALASAILTLAILIFSEIIPKTVGATYWKALAPICAYFIQALIVLLYPLVVALEALSRRLAGKGAAHAISRDELTVLAGMGENEGTLAKREAQIIRNALQLDAVTAQEVMTPRSVMVAFPGDMTVDAVLSEHARLRFARMPVYGEGLDDVQGVVLRHRLMEESAAGRGSTPLAKLCRPVHAVPRTKSVASLLDEFLERGDHVFLVVDEYGGTEGIVSLEDVIETLLSAEIVDELDPAADMRKLAIDRWSAKREEMDL